MGYKWLHSSTYIDSKGKKHIVRIYDTWHGMIYRCTNPKSKSYEDYGGRCISVCEEWLNYDNFYEWAMANGYDDTLTIDRIDVNGNYEPSNCRWVSMKVQNRNKRNNILVHGKTLAEISEETGLSLGMLTSRYYVGGRRTPEELLKSAEDVHTEGVKKQRAKLCTRFVEGKSLRTIADETGIDYRLIKGRYDDGARCINDLIKPKYGKEWRKNKSKIVVEGKTLREIAEENSFSITTIRTRYKAGIRTIEELIVPLHKGSK